MCRCAGTRSVPTTLKTLGENAGPQRMNASRLVGTHDVLFITLDTLRYDVASRLHQKAARQIFPR